MTCHGRRWRTKHFLTFRKWANNYEMKKKKKQNKFKKKDLQCDICFSQNKQTMDTKTNPRLNSLPLRGSSDDLHGSDAIGFHGCGKVDTCIHVLPVHHADNS